jgi:adenosylcobyric acid synthase
VIGTYVHGLFDDDTFRHGFVAAARAAAGLAPAAGCAYVTAERETRIDRWADHLRRSLNMHLIRSWIVDPPRRARRKKIL